MGTLFRLLCIVGCCCPASDSTAQKTPQFFYYREDKETGEIMVRPVWKKPSGGIISFGSSREFIEPGEGEKWVKKFNNDKTENYRRMEFVYLRDVAYDSTAIIITTKESAQRLDEQKTKPPIKQEDIPELKDEETSAARADHYLAKNALFTVPVNLTSSIKSNFGLPATKAFTCAAIQDGQLINGRICIQFFSDRFSGPIGYYQGEMKQGLADGYGVFVKPYFNNDGRPIRLKSNKREKVVYYVRQGFWKKGAFIHESEAASIMDSSLNRIAGFNKLFYVPEGVQLAKELVYAVYRRDSLNSSLSNGHIIKYNIVWREPYQSGILNRNILFREAYADFDTAFAVVDVLGSDARTVAVSGAAEQPFSMGNILRSFFTTTIDWSNSSTTLFDDYTLIKETGWNNYNNRVCEYETETDPNTSQQTRTPVSWQHDSYNAMEISIRTARNKDWQLLGTYTMQKKRNCYGGEETTMENSDGSVYPISSLREAKIDAIRNIKSKYPDPLNDTTVSTFVAASNRKFTSLMKRIAGSDRFKSSPQQPLNGAWYDPARNRIYLVEDAQKGPVICIENGNDELTGEKGYYGSMQHLLIKWMSSNNFRLVAKKEFFTSDFSFSNAVAGKPSKTVFIHEDLQIKQATADRIDFEEGPYWIRIQ